jgi:sulfur relay (sulfurtransferase) DsrC/TusE family protein
MEEIQKIIQRSKSGIGYIRTEGEKIEIHVFLRNLDDWNILSLLPLTKEERRKLVAMSKNIIKKQGRHHYFDIFKFTPKFERFVLRIIKKYSVHLLLKQIEFLEKQVESLGRNIA